MYIYILESRARFARAQFSRISILKGSICHSLISSDKHTSDSILKLKLPPTIVQNPTPRGPNGVQNPFWGPPGRPH